MRNLRSCIKVAADFVAPEHVVHCVRFTEELRQLPTWHHRRQDVLSIRAILFYAACACFAAFEEHRKREEAKREKQRRLDRKHSVSLDPPANAPAAPATAAAPPTGTHAPGTVSLQEPAMTCTSSAALGEEVASALML